MTGDMSGVRTRQRKLLFVPERADGPSLSINNIHTYISYILSTAFKIEELGPRKDLRRGDLRCGSMIGDVEGELSPPLQAKNNYRI
jgi:hypothetical protein